MESFFSVERERERIIENISSEAVNNRGEQGWEGEGYMG